MPIYNWRPLTPTDIPALMHVANTVHTTLPERPEVFLERCNLYPTGCLVLDVSPSAKPAAAHTSSSAPAFASSQPTLPLIQGGSVEICGYAISHPIRTHQPPPLDTLLGNIPADAKQYYIHDVAILSEHRGRGLAAEAVGRLRAVAERSAFASTGLVAVYGSKGFWGRFGFEEERGEGEEEDLKRKVEGYGGDAVWLVRKG
ncbi:uncharacterized protein BP01DRAFT_423021 [Aspergillus saccharolyticus JOP 1030-1]|uniref:N-acetyltransferase domain-containing protein n=1 Tax=Aspergillus saccharolyticus JOP 1030-1 TaxID=1450539 RepID=A0A318ZGX4_9EURO|nr:hypothetical protein BP01DRAFT_423021 [Aspergillus saccharolyticus JOP 1030-1]PYH46007.1 hypothetical protein BP01DRAFT_423021 [Aspergillus saccharolyticus JOP 1030-1]